MLVFDPDGAFLRSYGQGEIFDSHGISIDRWDRVWIADRDAHQIVVFNLEGEAAVADRRATRPAMDVSVQPSDTSRRRA